MTPTGILSRRAAIQQRYQNVFNDLEKKSVRVQTVTTPEAHAIGHNLAWALGQWSQTFTAQATPPPNQPRRVCLLSNLRSSVRPLSIARFRWYGICATWPEAIRALTVTRLRSRGARPGRSHRSRKRTSVVYCMSPGATVPNCSLTGYFTGDIDLFTASPTHLLSSNLVDLHLLSATAGDTFAMGLRNTAEITFPTPEIDA